MLSGVRVITSTSAQQSGQQATAVLARRITKKVSVSTVILVVLFTTAVPLQCEQTSVNARVATKLRQLCGIHLWECDQSPPACRCGTRPFHSKRCYVRGGAGVYQDGRGG